MTDAERAVSLRETLPGAPREEAGFIGEEGRRLFLYSHLPKGQVRGAVVVCPSIGAEFRRNYNREIALGRALAVRGVGVIRFHYRGTGASDGDPGELTVDTMVDDTLVVAGSAVERAGRVAFVGTRLGATVAATAADRYPGAPVALWDPVADADAFLREMQRSRLVRDLRAGGRSSYAPAEEIRELGRMDILGYPIGRALLDGLPDATGSRVGPRPLMLVSLGRSNGAHPRHVALAERWREEGAEVDLRSLAGYGSWWLYDQRELAGEAESGSSDLLDPTVEFLAIRLGGQEP